MKMCEIEGCPAAVSRAIADRIEPTDERAHLCPGHAYALVMLIEERTENQWYQTWDDVDLIPPFMNACEIVAKRHRERLLEWRRRNPSVRNVDRSN